MVRLFVRELAHSSLRVITTKAAPSPKLSPARESSKGLQRSLSRIISVLNPFKWNFDKASAPPAITISASSLLNISAPTAMAFKDAEQAVLTVHISALIPQMLAISEVQLPQS